MDRLSADDQFQVWEYYDYVLDNMNDSDQFKRWNASNYDLMNNVPAYNQCQKWQVIGSHVNSSDAAVGFIDCEVVASIDNGLTAYGQYKLWEQYEPAAKNLSADDTFAVWKQYDDTIDGLDAASQSALREVFEASTSDLIAYGQFELARQLQDSDELGAFDQFKIWEEFTSTFSINLLSMVALTVLALLAVRMLREWFVKQCCPARCCKKGGSGLAEHLLLGDGNGAAAGREGGALHDLVATQDGADVSEPLDNIVWISKPEFFIVGVLFNGGSSYTLGTFLALTGAAASFSACGKCYRKSRSGEVAEQAVNVNPHRLLTVKNFHPTLDGEKDKRRPIGNKYVPKSMKCGASA
jgi:hypothetical protein